MSFAGVIAPERAIDISSNSGSAQSDKVVVAGKAVIVSAFQSALDHVTSTVGIGSAISGHIEARLLKLKPIRSEWAADQVANYSQLRFVDYTEQARVEVKALDLELVDARSFHNAVYRTEDALSVDSGWCSAKDLPADTKALARQIASELDRYGMPVSPSILANPIGEFVFEWDRGEKRVTLYVQDGEARFLKSTGSRMDDDMASGDIEDPGEVHELMRWLGDVA